MVGRISSAEVYRVGISSVIDAQRLLQRTQEQLAKGTPILQAADDPVAAAQITGLREELNRLDTLSINATRAESSLAFADQALGNAEEVLQRARELALTANNAALTSAERETIGKEVDGLLGRLLTIGNTENADGEFIFAGYESNTVPYVQSVAPGGEVVDYNGDQGVREVNLARGVTIAVNTPGSEIFDSTPGNGSFAVTAEPTNTGTGVVGITTADTTFDKSQDYTISFIQATPTDPVTWQVTDSTTAIVASGTYGTDKSINFGGASVFVEGNPANGDTFNVIGNESNGPIPRIQSAFQTLINLRDALLAPDADTPDGRARADTAINQAVYGIDQNLQTVSLARTDLGVRMGRVDGQVELNESFNIQLEKTLGELEGLDYAEAVSQLELQLVALQAAQQTFVKTTGLSLFNYL